VKKLNRKLVLADTDKTVTVEPTKAVEPEPIVEKEPVVEPEPAVEPEPIVEKETVVEGEPVVEGEVVVPEKKPRKPRTKKIEAAVVPQENMEIEEEPKKTNAKTKKLKLKLQE
jgi:fused signal recognition particle receptor